LGVGTVGILLAVLATVSIVLAFIPSWRARVQWGRTADTAPVSRGGCLGVAAGFLIMSGGLGAVHVGAVEGDVAILVVLGGFAVFILAGLVDRMVSNRGPRP